MGKKITSREQDYSQWYNEIVQGADLAENSGVRGCMVIKPYGYAIWEKMQAELDRMFKETGCDGVMVGRSALGNPWFFKEAIALYEGKKIESKPTINDKVNCCLKHFNKMIEWHGEKIAVNLMKKHFGWYIRGFQDSSTIRKALVSAKDKYTIISILDSVT